jgi:hypothetical protein
MALTPDDIMLEQYKQLRTEILAALGFRLTVVQFGFAILGAGFTAGIGLYNVAPLLSSFIFYIFIPFSNWSMTLIWLEEHIRITRAGGFLFYIESNLKANCGDFKMWEHYLEENRLHRPIATMITIIYFLFTGFLAMIIGIFISVKEKTITEILDKINFGFSAELKLFITGFATHIILYSIIFRIYYKNKLSGLSLKTPPNSTISNAAGAT